MDDLIAQLKELDDHDPRGLDLAVQIWNECVPVGSMVNYERDGTWHSQEWSTTRGPAFVRNGKLVVRVKGIMGPISLDRVEPAEYGAQQMLDYARMKLRKGA